KVALASWRLTRSTARTVCGPWSRPSFGALRCTVSVQESEPFWPSVWSSQRKTTRIRQRTLSGALSWKVAVIVVLALPAGGSRARLAAKLGAAVAGVAPTVTASVAPTATAAPSRPEGKHRRARISPWCTSGVPGGRPSRLASLPRGYPSAAGRHEFGGRLRSLLTSGFAAGGEQRREQRGGAQGERTDLLCGGGTGHEVRRPAHRPAPRTAPPHAPPTRVDLGLVVPESRNNAAFVADTTPRSAFAGARGGAAVRGVARGGRHRTGR